MDAMKHEDRARREALQHRADVLEEELKRKKKEAKQLKEVIDGLRQRAKGE